MKDGMYSAPVAFDDASAESFKGEVYVVGGVDQSATWKLNLGSNKWNKLASAPNVYAEFTSALWDGQIWMMGPWRFNNKIGAQHGGKQTQYYDIASGQWKTGPNMVRSLAFCAGVGKLCSWAF